MKRTLFWASLSIGTFSLGLFGALGIDVLNTAISTKSQIAQAEVATVILGEFSEIDNADNNITIGWVGDIVPSEITPVVSPKVRDWLESPDLLIGNLEGTLGVDPQTKCSASPESCYTFVGTADFMQSLKDAGFDAMNVANNHTYDGGSIGFLDIKNIFKATDMLMVGEKGETTITEVNGKQIAILGFSTNFWTDSILDIEKIKQKISEVSLEYPIVIVTFHGGAEGEGSTHITGNTEYYRGENRGNPYDFAHTAIDAGADLVLGSGPHVVRAIEKYQNRLIVYSAGNFLTTEGMSNSGILGSGALFDVTIDNTGSFKNLAIHSVTTETNNYVSEDESSTALSNIVALTEEDIGQIISGDINGNISIIKSDVITKPKEKVVALKITDTPPVKTETVVEKCPSPPDTQRGGNLSSHNFADENSIGNYVPEDLEYIPETLTNGLKICLESSAQKNLEEMLEKAEKEKLYIVVTSGFRDIKLQGKLYNPDIQGAKEFPTIAKPGHSEHQLGTAVDLSGRSINYLGATNIFETTPEYEWLKDNAYKYGFVLSYPKGKEKITGYSYESWHWRYVGVDIAQKVHDTGLTLAETLEN